MKFAELLYKFQHEIKSHYGPDCEITKIAINRKLMHEVQMDKYNSNPMVFTIDDAREPKVLGIPLYVREKEDF